MIKLSVFIFSLFFWVGIIFSTNSCAPESEGDSISSEEVVTAFGAITGTITDATDGSAIVGGDVYIQGFQASTATTTDSSGDYTIALAPEGSRVLIAEKSGYTDGELDVTPEEGVTGTGNNLSLVPTAFGSGKFVIVLTWADEPLDLDSYLWVPNGGPMKVFYGARGDDDGTLDADPFAALDNDEVNGYGPETMTVATTGNSPHYSGSYRYYVHRFTTEALITESLAIVKLYRNGTLLKTYNVPTSGTGDFWHVFDISSNGTITDVDVIQALEPVSP